MRDVGAFAHLTLRVHRPADIVHHPSWRLAIMVTAMQPWAQLIPEWQLKAIFYSFLVRACMSGRRVQAAFVHARVCGWGGVCI